jgi:hypothetical protein
MGASEWYYFVPYQEDVEQAFIALQGRVLAERDYYTDSTIGELESMAELQALKRTEEFWEVGTHSILDMHAVRDAPWDDQGDDDPGAILPLAPDELRGYLGGDTPDKSDFERHRKAQSWMEFPRWTGRYTVLYRDGKAHEIAFWGYSGD